MCIFVRYLNFYTGMDDKNQRHQDIRQIIALENINSQNDLLEILVSKGHTVTQATLSRDLKQLKASKIPNEQGGYKYIINDKASEKKSVASSDDYIMGGFISIEFSNNLGIITSKPAFSSPIASAIDNAKLREVLGTIAGDDTILIIAREGFSKHDVIRALKNKFPVLKTIIR
jgi:transcriptional regulator of arginine metabolism